MRISTFLVGDTIAVDESKVSNRVLSGKSFVPACKYILTFGMFIYIFVCSRDLNPSSGNGGSGGHFFLCSRVLNLSPRSVTESSLGDGIFFFTTTYGSAYEVVVMSLCQFFVRGQ